MYSSHNTKNCVETTCDVVKPQKVNWRDHCVSLCVFPKVSAVNLEGELFKDLMKGYDKNVRPMEKNGNITQVFIKMILTNLISLVIGAQSDVFSLIPVTAQIIGLILFPYLRMRRRRP